MIVFKILGFAAFLILLPQIFVAEPQKPSLASSTSTDTKFADDSLDENAAILTQQEIGHDLIRQEISRFILASAAKLVGLRTKSIEGGSYQRRNPIFKLLQLAKVVMQETCISIPPSFFTMAVYSFINLAEESFYSLEPYISYPAFVRIETALKRCISDAKAHVFYQEGFVTRTNETNGKNQTQTDYCRSEQFLSTSRQVLRRINPTDSEPSVVNVTVPEYGTGIRINGTRIAVNDPLIEAVWKIVVNAHSYCYTKFGDHFNDHHTFTISLLPLFSNNEVQDVWLGKDGAGYDLESGLFYGGLFGDIHKLLSDINNCVGASRHDGVSYPWYLSVPAKVKTSS